MSDDKAATPSQPTTHSTWVRDILLIPLIVALLAAAAGYFVPKMFDKGKELSYAVDGPIRYIDTDVAKNLKVVVNDVPVTSLYTYTVKLWNSGDTPISGVPVRLVFESTEPSFRVLSLTHSTSPAYEFGAIREEADEPQSRRLTYELLNPGDADTITFFTNSAPKLALYCKSSGLSTRSVDPLEASSFIGWFSVLGKVVITVFVAAFLALAVYGLKHSDASKIETP